MNPTFPSDPRSDVRAISGRAKVAGVIGWPVHHSLSPRLHGYWLAEHHIDGAYVPLAVRPEHLEDALAALPKLGFVGANVTVPHKQAAATLTANIDGQARRIGSINTLVVRADGTLEGFSTDGFGFLASLAEARPEAMLRGQRAVVIGSGGAASAIAAALQEAGAAEIIIVNRTDERSESLARALGPPVRSAAWCHRHEILAAAALLVNATTQGMTGQPPLDLDLTHLPPSALVTDVVYTPLMTPLLCAAQARGNPIIDGLGMLLHQARPGFARWFGTMPEVTAALRRFILASPSAS